MKTYDLTAKQVCQMLGKSYPWLIVKIREGLPTLQVGKGGHYRFNGNEVIEWVETQKRIMNERFAKSINAKELV